MTPTEDSIQIALDGIKASMEVATYGRRLWNLVHHQLNVIPPETANLSKTELESLLEDYLTNLHLALKRMLEAGCAFSDGIEFCLGPSYAMIHPKNTTEQERVKKTAAKIKTVFDGTYFKPHEGLEDAPPAESPYKPSPEKANVSKSDISFHSMQAANLLYMHYGEKLREMPKKLNRDFISSSQTIHETFNQTQQLSVELFEIVAKLAFACDLMINVAITMVSSKKEAWKFLRNHYGNVKHVRDEFASLLFLH